MKICPLSIGKRSVFLAVSFLFFLSMLLCSGCGDDDGVAGESAAKSPYKSFTTATKSIYRITGNNGSVEEVVAGKVGETTVQGASFDRYQVGTFSQTQPEGPEFWIDIEPNQVTMAGGQIYWNGSGLTEPGEPFVTGELEEAIVIPFDDEPGTTHEFPVKGEAIIGDPATSTTKIDVDTTVEITTQAQDAAFETPVGTLEGCTIYSGTTTYNDLVVNGEAVYHPTFGLVSVTLDWPQPDGVTIDFLGNYDNGDESRGNIQAMNVIDATTPEFLLDTYYVNGTFDADKNTHAKMLLELRYVDEEKAKSGDMPQAYVEFGTAMGYFPSNLIESPISFFFPEENDKGYTYWIGYVDQAAKNEPENGISYHIRATAQAGDSPLRATARIVYKLYQP